MTPLVWTKNVVAFSPYSTVLDLRFFRPDQKRTRKPKAKRRGTPGHTDLVLDIPTEKEAMRGANGDFTHMNNGSGNKRFVPPSSTEGRPLAVKGSVADTVNRAFGKK